MSALSACRLNRPGFDGASKTRRMPLLRTSVPMNCVSVRRVWHVGPPVGRVGMIKHIADPARRASQGPA